MRTLRRDDGCTPRQDVQGDGLRCPRERSDPGDGDFLGEFPGNVLSRAVGFTVGRRWQPRTGTSRLAGIIGTAVPIIRPLRAGADVPNDP